MLKELIESNDGGCCVRANEPIRSNGAVTKLTARDVRLKKPSSSSSGRSDMRAGAEVSPSL